MRLQTLLLVSMSLVCAFSSAGLRAEPAPREIAITANDAMQFDLKEIVAAPGERIALKLSHIGKLPKTAMGHNWALFSALPDAELTKLLMDAMKNTPDYLPADRSALIAHTRILGGGESEIIVFVAPSKTGSYPYFCTFPGHFSMMKGRLVVK